MMRVYCIFLSLVIAVFGQDPQQFQQFGPTLVNEGDKNCAQFYYAPNSLSAKCLVHKLTLDADRLSPFTITLTGLEVPDYTGNTELTISIDQCQTTLSILCYQEQYCTAEYTNRNDFKATVKAGLLRFSVTGDQISAELARNRSVDSTEIHQCTGQSKALNMMRSRHEIRIYLNRAFPGHNFEISGADVQRYRNGQSIYSEQGTRTETDQTTFGPFAASSPEPNAMEMFRAAMFPTTMQPQILPFYPTTPNTEAAVIIEDRRRMEVKKRVDGQFGVEEFQKSAVSMERMQRTPDGKSLLLDLIIRTRVEVPTNF